MTEEERQKTILELERAVCKPIPKREPKVNKCECCGEPLVDGKCLDHASYVRMHQQYLNKMREQYDYRG
jgi:hypothetical protein